jgi:hypothetical protein
MWVKSVARHIGQQRFHFKLSAVQNAKSLLWSDLRREGDERSSRMAVNRHLPRLRAIIEEMTLAV